MKKKLSILTLAAILLFTTLFTAGVFNIVPGNANVVKAATKSKDITRDGKKERSIVKGKTIELEVHKPKSVKDKDLTWTIKDSAIVKFAGKERHDDDIKFKAQKAGTTTITCQNTRTGKKVTFKITVKNAPKITTVPSKNKTINAKGSLKRNVKLNRELELEVKKTKGKGVKDSQLKWTIKDSSILAFEDPEDGIYDDEMEFIGKKAGTTTVTCTNTANHEKVTFIVTVK